MPKRKTSGGEHMNSENVEVWDERLGTALRYAGYDDLSAGDGSTDVRSALLAPHWLINEREPARARLKGSVQLNAELIEQLAAMNAKLEAEIAKRKHAEDALRQAQADLAHANRVSSMGELSASLAHEVSQPIAAAIMDANTCLRWLAREKPDWEEVRAAASRVVQDGERADQIIKRVRQLFQKDTQQRELMDINEVIGEMLLLLHSEATEHGVVMRTELAADLPQVMGDRVQLQQMLLNLIKNGIDAMEDVEGTRELTIQSQRGEDGQVLITVSDTGVGLPPQNVEKIFNAFFTTKPNGTGIGLRISRSIVESHGGRLWASDNLPHGARFCFTLPGSRAPQQATERR
jgi:C4-dicarboxylate-specific signal transduction histidine kinase